MIENRVYITAAAFASLAFNGMTYAFMGTSLPAIQSHLEIGIDLAGILMASFQTGVTVFSFIGGIMSDCYRRERILMGGCLVLCDLDCRMDHGRWYGLYSEWIKHVARQFVSYP